MQGKSGIISVYTKTNGNAIGGECSISMVELIIDIYEYMIMLNIYLICIHIHVVSHKYTHDK